MTCAFAAVGAEASDHWAFQPVTRPSVPAVSGAAWPSGALDHFVLAKLREYGMQPARRAGRRTLIRRVTLDLTGLPPTPGEVDAFVATDSPGAYRRLVERVLASPRFGERWGRHWLDVARYADTKGYLAGNQARLFTHSYTYRDYVIDAFNADLPYDRFIIEQVAADKLELGDDKQPLAAMGFLTLGRRFLNNPHDIIDDRIDVVTRGMMGLTVSCARCHDHKYDPIPIADYYSLYGVFASSHEPGDKPFISDAIDPIERVAFDEERKRREDKLNNYKREQYARVREQVKEQTGDYVWAAHRAAKLPAGKVDELARKAKLDPELTRRWMRHLAKRRESGDPVFAAWFTLTKLDAGLFGEQAKAVLGGEPLANAHPAVRAALAEAGSLEAAAKSLGQLLYKAKSGQPKLREAVHSDDSPAKLSDGDVNRVMDVEGRQGIRSRKRKFDELEGEHPGAPNRAMVLLDNASPHDPRIFRRGNPGMKGDAVPRRFIAALSHGERKPFVEGSGRLEMAEAIADPGNPLTARVMANRVWQRLFGTGLVITPSDFGVRAEPPSHPKMLDFLAADFVDNGWSVKALIRGIVTSSTYQQGETVHPKYAERDPGNRLLWQMNRKRLDFEAMRDSVLSVSGNLTLKQGGRSVHIANKPDARCRTVYGFVNRQNLPNLFRTFDFAGPDTTCPQRFTTTVPQQALYLLNSPFIEAQAKRLGARSGVTSADDEERIRVIYRLAYQREPSAEELALAKGFVDEFVPSAAAWERLGQALLVSNEMMFVD
ncbi:MAG: DUF1549 and DUF1553 domain-containing protein [Verrucomicrobiota bacterium]|nr:DUF1549 and DUF1553 domain-containing protein [Verrucomicrobiota bacterium]